MKIAMANDHGGYEYKLEIKAMLEEMGHEVKDFGAYDTNAVDYPDVAIPAAKAVAAGEFDRGIFICGTGIGIGLAANKVKGIRCALLSDCFSAKATRDHNDTNCMSLGQRVIGIELAKQIVQIWIDTPFSGAEKHARRVAKVMALENE